MYVFSLEQVAMSEVEIGNMSHEVIEIAPTIVEEEPMVEIDTGTVSESGGMFVFVCNTNSGLI